MTTTRRWLIALAVATFVAFLALSAPATLVSDRLSAADSALTLTGVSGTAWRGHAGQVRYGQVAVGTLDWRLAGARLLVAQGAAHLALVGP
ncbi:MAG: type II secretion system protein N, partial [Gammaproteobacteria bacterium]